MSKSCSGAGDGAAPQQKACESDNEKARTDSSGKKMGGNQAHVKKRASKRANVRILWTRGAREGGSLPAVYSAGTCPRDSPG